MKAYKVANGVVDIESIQHIWEPIAFMPDIPKYSCWKISFVTSQQDSWRFPDKQSAWKAYLEITRYMLTGKI